MRISDISIRNPVFAWMLMIGLMIFGGISFSKMGISQMPDVDFPVVNISASLEGAAPEVMETTVVDPIEDAVMSIQGVRSISSSSKRASANITVDFEIGKDIDSAVGEIQNKIIQIQKTLPSNLEPLSITKTNPDDQPIISVAVSSKSGNRLALSYFVRDFIKNQFSMLNGVGDVSISGYVEPNLRVWINPKKLTQYNISVNDIINSIQSGHVEIPGGQIDSETKSFNVRTYGEAKSVAEFGEIIISSRAGQSIQNPFQMVRLKDVARIEEGLADITRTSRFNKEFALGLRIQKQKGSNAVAVASAVKKKVEELKKTLPPDYSIGINFDSTRFIEDSIHELNFTLILSALLTALACWVFLGSWSATLNVVLSIPTSILGTFIVLYFMGFTLNTFTLLGLSLAIGIVVDDAIMVLENIFRHNEIGKSKIESAIVGAREITFAAIAATFAIMAIFLPVAFMKGIIGKYFMQFGVTISVAVFLSLVEALTITPMRSSQFVSRSERKSKLGEAFDFFIEKTTLFYKKTLRLSLQRKSRVLIGAALFMVFSFFLAGLLNKEMSPSQDQSIFLVRLQAPPGSSLSFTDDRVKKAEEFLYSRGEVEKAYVSVGGFGSGPGDSSSAMAFVTMKPKSERPKDAKSGKRLSQKEFMDVARANLKKIPDLKPSFQDLSLRGFSSSRGFPVEFTIQGDDWEKLGELSSLIVNEMEKSGLMTDSDSNYLLGAPEIQITPDRKLAAMHGISFQAVGQTVNAMIGGVRVGQYQKAGHRYDIRVQVEKEISNVDLIKNLMVGNARSNLIPLFQVVQQETKPTLQSINRIDRQRSVSIFANLKTGVSQSLALKKAEEISKKILPADYTVQFGGSSKTMNESFESLWYAFFFGIVLAYMILATQFNSYIDPVTVLVALPFSISGAFLALLITQQSLNLFSMIGLILLAGIVKKNSILLVEFTNVIRDRGQTDVTKALEEACPIRLRPILMTSIATIVGAIPGALAMGPGAETRIPMSIAVIGGVLVSTILTLYVVPCAYLVLSKFEKRSKSTFEIRKAFASVGNSGLDE